MKNITLQTIVLVIFLVACQTSSDPKTNRTDTPIISQPNVERQITVQNNDSNTKQLIYVNVHTDTTLMRALITKLSQKAGKSNWDTILPILCAMIPILLGFLGYKYAIRQLVAKQRIDWVASFRPLVSKLIAEILKVESTLQEFVYLEKEVETGQTNVSDLETKLAESTRLKKLVSKEMRDNLDSAKSQLAQIINEKSEAVKRYKNEFFVMYPLLQEVIINLDPVTYPEQNKLEKTIELYQKSFDSETGLGTETLGKDLLEQIRKVITEQNRLAKGEIV
jgi:hypothetical protein